MKLLRLTMAGLAMLCLTGWVALRKPYSPTQDLPLVAYSAFDLQGAVPNDADALLTEVRTWDGVTAASYNPDSQILAVAHETTVAEQDLLARLNQASSTPVALKVFPKPQGPECPVPHEAIMAAFPGWLLYTGIGLGLLFAFSVYRDKRRLVISG